MNEEQLDLFKSPEERVLLAPQARRDDGMRRAEEHADRVTHAWSVLAYQTLHAFLKFDPGRVFLAEDFVRFALDHGTPEPPDRRAFGAVINRAARNGLIVKSGYAEDRFCSPKTVWRRA